MTTATKATAKLRHDWDTDSISTFFELPFSDLLFQAQQVHRQNFDPNTVQVSTLLSIKTGGCPEDCGYCSQSAHHKADVEREKLMDVEKVIEEARKAKQIGATRFCMGAAWKKPNDRDFEIVLDMVRGVKEIGMETCVTLGMLSTKQANSLKQAGLDYYNHNLDTSPEYYKEIITTRTYEDRLQTLKDVRNADINVCAGGIIGMGESRKDRVRLLQMLANLPVHPESVPINRLVKVEGTPLSNVNGIDNLEFVRTIAVARILMPKSTVRLSAGRTSMSDEMQALCFFAGASSIFYGKRLLTTPNPEADHDRQLFNRLGIQTLQ